MNNISEEELGKRLEWELCAPNAYQQPDEQVIAMIYEIRRLRSNLKETET